MILPSFAFANMDQKPSCIKVVKKVQKPNGIITFREQFKPNDSLRKVHHFAKCRIQEQLDLFDISFESATAFIRGGGINKHFLRHVNQAGLFNQYWFVTDLKHAYKTVNRDVLIDMLRQLFMIDPNPYEPGSPEWMNMEHFFWEFPPPLRSRFSKYEIGLYLNDYFLNPETHGGLAEGFSSSPFLFNLYCEIAIDRPLRELCSKWDVSYSRYADDLFFSSDVPLGKVKRQKIKKLIAKWFEINQEKTKFFDINDYPQGVELVKCIARNNHGQAEVLPLRKKRAVFQRLVYKGYFHHNADRESLAEQHGAIAQKTQFLGRGGPMPPARLRKALTLYRLYGNLTRGDAIAAKTPS